MTHVITEPVHGIGYRMSEWDEGFDIPKEARILSPTHTVQTAHGDQPVFNSMSIGDGSNGG